MTEARTGVRDLERALAAGGHRCLATILELSDRRRFLILHQQIDLQVHLIEFFLVRDNARGLVLLLQLEVRFKLVDVSLEHFNQKLKRIAYLVRESHRRVERANVVGNLALRTILLLRQLALDQRLVELLRHLDALFLSRVVSQLLSLVLL